MSKFTHIYTKNKEEIKFLDTLNYTLEEFSFKNPCQIIKRKNKKE